jgi:tRNA (adenine57-N1/adenine58-N1)-methyltransferase
VEVCEILLRYYKPDPVHLRPTDRMVAHTGYLIYGRRVEVSDLQKDDEPVEEVEE